MTTFMKISVPMLLFGLFFSVNAVAQPGISGINPVTSPTFPRFQPQYPVTQPSYQVPNYRTNYPPGAGFPLRPFRQQSFADYAASPNWTQGVIKQEDRSFNFKTVARGAKCEHRFVLYNPCAENLHIASVSASCTCTTPFILDEKSELQTYEKTAIVAHFHTEAFEGLKNATITVVIDKPQYAEIQLQVQGNIRSDISMTPSEVRFGPVKEGQEAERTITVVYTGGNAAWRIVDFTCPNESLSAEIVDVQGTPGRTTTKVKVKLAADAPRGELNERLYMISNDFDSRRELPILVTATVGKVLTVTPQTQFLGFLKSGAPSIKKTTLIRGTQPFKITKIDCDDPNVEIAFTPDPDAPAKGIYLIPVLFKNPADGSPKLNKEDGMLHAVVKVETDDPTLKTSFNVTAKVVNEEPE